jgi:hypothetical protein
MVFKFILIVNTVYRTDHISARISVVTVVVLTIHQVFRDVLPCQVGNSFMTF